MFHIVLEGTDLLIEGRIHDFRIILVKQKFFQYRRLKLSDVSATEERTGLPRDDRNAKIALSWFPSWQNGRCLTWGTTLVESLATSYRSSTYLHTGSAAEAAIEVGGNQARSHFRSGRNIRTSQRQRFLFS